MLFIIICNALYTTHSEVRSTCVLWWSEFMDLTMSRVLGVKLRTNAAECALMLYKHMGTFTPEIAHARLV